jgi:hypothetical protein
MELPRPTPRNLPKVDEQSAMPSQHKNDFVFATKQSFKATCQEKTVENTPKNASGFAVTE